MDKVKERQSSFPFSSQLSCTSEGQWSWESHSKQAGGEKQGAASPPGKSTLWIINQTLCLSKVTYTERVLFSWSKGLMHKPGWHLSTDSLPLAFNSFRYSTRAVSIPEGSLSPLYCMWACSSQYSYIKQWKKPGYSLLPLNFFFFSIHILYSAFKAISAAQLLYRDSDSYGPAWSDTYLEYPFTLFDFCSQLYNEEGVCIEFGDSY